MPASMVTLLWGVRRIRRPGQAAVLLADPGLLEDEIWRLFTVPGCGAALIGADHHLARLADDRGLAADWGWAPAIARLSAAGHLDRDRLLDACLAAFTRDFGPRVAWYAGLLKRLGPTLDEMARRVPAYLGLLGAPTRDAIVIGQAAARSLLTAGRLEPARLLAAAAPPLLFPTKAVAAAQLRLIGEIIRRDPATAGRAAEVAATAFGHDRQDVQEAALALFRRHRLHERADPAALRARAADLSAALAADAAALGPGPGTAPDGRPAGGAPRDTADRPRPGPDCLPADLRRRISALPPGGSGLPAALAVAERGGVPGPAPFRPGPGTPLPAAVTDPAELIQLLAALLEDARDPIAAERALGGAVRLSGLPPRERRQAAAPLLKRVEKIMNPYSPFSGRSIAEDLAMVAWAWAGQEVRFRGRLRGREDEWPRRNSYAVTGTGEPVSIAGMFSARAWAASRVIEAGQGGVLLAEPETSRAAISRGTLLERIRRAAGRPSARADHDAALLRLEPGADGDDALWAAWDQLAGTAPGALRAAYRATRVPADLTAVAGVPADVRSWTRDKHLHLLARTAGPVPSAPACPAWAVLTGTLADPLASYDLQIGPTRYNPRRDPEVAAWVLTCPWQPELAAAYLLGPISESLARERRRNAATTAVTALLDPGHALGPAGHLALVTALGSAEAETRVAAAQLWADAATDGRLDPALAARALVTGVSGEVLLLSRVAGSLRYAASAPLPARRVAEAICASLPDLAARPPAGLHLLLELAARLGSETGLPDRPAEVAALAARTGGSRLSVTARQLARAAGAPAPDRPAAAAAALAALVSRAEGGARG
jgi:hypothetical protein